MTLLIEMQDPVQSGQGLHCLLRIINLKTCLTSHQFKKKALKKKLC